MVDIGKFLDGSLLAADAEIFSENQVFVCRQDAVKQGIDLLCDLKTGRTMEGMMVLAVIFDAVLRSEVLPLVLVLHVGVLLVKVFPVGVHLLLFDNPEIIRIAGVRAWLAQNRPVMWFILSFRRLSWEEHDTLVTAPQQPCGLPRRAAVPQIPHLTFGLLRS